MSSPTDVAAGAEPPRITLSAADSANSRFDRFRESRRISLKRNPIFGRDDTFFTIGSCFAEEIRIALTRSRIACLPTYRNIKFDPEVAVVDELPRREHMNFYNTFTVRLQFEQMLGLWDQPADDYWTISRAKKSLVPWSEPVAYQDPYRRLILAKSPDHLRAIIDSMNATMLDGFNRSSAFILTYGMTEVFLNKATGKAASQKPAYLGGGGVEETVFHRSTFEENLDNVLSTIDMIQSRKPGRPIVMSVSPVPLARTFSSDDVITANMESKSLLRAVLGVASRSRENVFYLPSYEYVTMLGLQDAFMHDLRHVQRPVVGRIIECFFDAFFRDGAADQKVLSQISQETEPAVGD